MLAEQLGKAWRERRASTAIDAVMRFADDGLVLGAGTILAASGGSGRDISIDPGEPRLAALLSATHRRRPSASSLVHLSKAAERWSQGQDALAAMHLALSRLDRLEHPEADAHRLFLADGLLNSGVDGDAIVAATEAGEPDLKALQKYNPDQPRVPAGSGRTSGEWTTTGSGAPNAQAAANTETHNNVAQHPPPSAGAAPSLGSASTTLPHRLTFTTFDGGPNDPAGWSGSFQLAQPTAVGGVVIQKVVRQPAAPSKPVIFWEALAYIPPHATSSGLLVDDSWTPPVNGTHGSDTTTATAMFYEGLTKSTLPNVFREGGVDEAGPAWATRTDPKHLLPQPSSAPLVRRGTLKY